MRIFKLLITIIILSSHATFAQTKTLFQGSERSDWYITLVGDTAFFEQFKMDKAPTFAAFDTLVLSGEGIYRGKNKVMAKRMDTINMSHRNGPFRGRTFQFLKANPKQQQKWEGYKNWISLYKWRYKRDSIRTVDVANSLTPEERTKLMADIKVLEEQLNSLDQKAFNAELNKLRTKYKID